MPHCRAFSAEFHMHLLFLFSAACRDKNICHYEHTETKMQIEVIQTSTVDLSSTTSSCPSA